MSNTIWEILLPAFGECLVLTGLHAYLGLHVLRRKVIFVDLSLAQIAALGTTVGLLFGLSTDSPGAYVLSLTFTLIGAGLFTVTRMRRTRVPQEAVIGLIYALAAALAILVVSQGPQGAKQVQSIMTGRLLWVDWGTVGVTASVYGSLGLVHWLFWRPLWRVSEDHEAARRAGMAIVAWDFLFYASFGVAISLSVRTAGVLLVFVFLVVPAMVALLVTQRRSLQLVVGWTVGTLVTASGLAIAHLFDLPSGPTVVTWYGVVLLPIALAVRVWRSQDRPRMARRVALGTAGLVVLVLAFTGLGRRLAGTAWAEGPGEQHHHSAAHVAQLDGVAGRRSRPAPASAAAPASAPAQQLDPEQLVEQVRSGALDRRAAAERLLQVLRSDAFPFEKGEAAAALDKLSGQSFGYDPDATEAANQAALQRAAKWAQKQQ
jgi:zinc/manganese transport system permease protein